MQWYGVQCSSGSISFCSETKSEKQHSHSRPMLVLYFTKEITETKVAHFLTIHYHPSFYDPILSANSSAHLASSLVPMYFYWFQLGVADPRINA
jgi:hypothetical protein